MKMMRTRTYKPNYALAEKKALEFIQKLDKKALPIKLISFKNIFNNLEIKKYSWYSKKMGLTISKVCSNLGSEDGCCVFNERNGKYRILYNDTIENEGRKRWTLAHELGHYALEHHKNYGCNIMKRSLISDEEYDVFEKEANCFARALLAPPHILFHIENANPIVIQEICNISLEASLNAFRFIKNGVKEFGIGYSKDFALKLGFGDFLHKINNKYFCENCHCHFVLDDPFYCPSCSNNSLTKTNKKIGDDFEMKYTGIEVDNNSRAKVCPTCDNNELNYSGDFCNVCGDYLVNQCADVTHWEFEDEILDKETCGTLLAGNARFCHKCGNPSTFYKKGYLKEWDYNSNNVFELPF